MRHGVAAKSKSTTPSKSADLHYPSSVHPYEASTLVCKLAAGQPVETRRKMKRRGFYVDPSPGFYDLKGKFEDAARANPEKLADVSPEVQARFDNYANLLRTKGVYAGTGHKRVLIPKSHISRDDVQNLGFESVLIAVPEKGQDEFRTYRHPDNLFHLHSHGDNWTMHEDAHPAATMLARRIGKTKALIQGLPHVVTEGIPGLGYYLKGQILGSKSTADNVEAELDPETKALLGVKARTQPLQLPAKLASFDEVFGFHAVKTSAADPLQPLIDVLQKTDFGFDENGKAKSVLRKRRGEAGSRGSEIEATIPVPFDW